MKEQTVTLPRLVVFTLALTAASTLTAEAQEKALVPLKLDIVITRQAGDKKVSSMPYSLWLTGNAPERQATSLRMGVSVPVPMAVLGGQPKDKDGEKTEPMRSYNYREIGTNIDASANSAADGRFALAITLNDSGLNTKGDAMAGGAPLLRNFTSRFFLLLRDGQTATYTSATDPVTGETLKVDVTLSVLK
jgi:hypothetical protein